MEIWKRIKGYEYYYISNLGNVKSKYPLKKDKLLKERITNSGYVRVCLYKDKKPKEYLIHRLVALSFIDNKYGKEQVNHINGNKKDNTVENLEWCSHSENMIHSLSLGRNKKATKIVRIGKDKKMYNRITEAAKDNDISRTAINNCLNGRSKTSGGFKWVYYD